MQKNCLQVRQGMSYNRDRDGESTDVAQALTDHHTLEAEEMGKDKNERNEEQSVARRSKDVGRHRFAAGLREHVSAHGEDVQWQRAELPVQGFGAHGDDRWIIAENSDNLRREEPS